MITPVSIIIPILNEAKTLPELLRGLERQTALPQEIIFVDAGSIDGGPDLIRDWWKSKGWVGGECLVLRRPGAFPGAGRNAGIEAAKGKWIAFLDGGTVPDPGWLESLLDYATTQHLEGVFGVARFEGHGPIGRAVCALSYGQGTSHPILPASLFERTVFAKVGLFSTDILAGEDTQWVRRYLKIYGEKRVCRDAVVSYCYFPDSLGGALKKWVLASANVVKAGEFQAQQVAYLLFFGVLSAGLWLDTVTALVVIVIYAVARGVFDPMRRSESWHWWKGEALAVAIALFLGPGLDLAKAGGFLAGHIGRLSRAA